MQPLTKDSILVVDDEPQVLVALEDVLGEEFTVLTADNAQTALAVLQKDPGISVIVTDQRMPNMTGDELLARVRTTSPAVSILLTGFADLTAVIRAVNDGRLFAYVTKPWDVADLRMKVAKAAQHYRLEQELTYERRLLTDLMQSAQDVIFFKDTELRFMRVNRAFAELCGASDPDTFTGKRLSDVGFQPGVAAAVEAEEREVLERGRPLVDKIRVWTNGGVERWFATTQAPIRGAAGEIVGLVAIARDVTKQRRLEQQLAQAQKMEAIGLLAGGVAHDFNNLLAVVASCADIVFNDLPQGDSLREEAGEIIEATRRAASLTRQLLAFSRRQVIAPKILDLNVVVSDTEKMLRRVIGEDIALELALSPVLGHLRADASQVEQVILNLAVNARDAMPDGGKLTIATLNTSFDDSAESSSGIRAGNYVTLTVTDTGTGMSAEVERRVFEPFFTTKDVGKGTGLGLSTVYGIAVQCGGAVDVQSELGKGATFRVHFPCVAGNATVEPVVYKSERPEAATTTILVIEDDEAVRRVAVRILRRHDFSVLEAQNPSDARRLVAEHGPNIGLLLTDVVMPEMNGPRLVEELTQGYPEMRVLYMSGYPGGSAARSVTMDSGAPLLAKPFTPSSLLEKVREILG